MENKENSNNKNNLREEDDRIIDNDIWDVIYSYFDDIEKQKNYYITKHHLDSYNNFVLNKIPQTFRENNPQTIYLGRNDEKKI